MHTLNILHLYVRLIRNKIQNLIYLASDLDILCSTEFHLDSDILDRDITIEGFSTILCRYILLSSWGGALVYVSDLLMAVRRSDLKPPILNAFG